MSSYQPCNFRTQAAMSNKRRPGSLRILAWNANSLKHRCQELEEIINRLDIDIAAVGETHWRMADSYSIPNYLTYKQSRQGRAGGGTAIFIKRNLEHHLCQAPQTQHLETTTVMIHTSSMGKLKIGAGYYPPGHPFIETDYEATVQDLTPMVLTGDLNAKHITWNCRTSNRYGKSMRKLADKHGWTIVAPDAPTHYPAHHDPDILDVALCSRIPLPITAQTLDELSSDHSPILLQIGDEDPYTQKLTRVNWPKFKDIVTTNFNVLQSNDSIELEVATKNLQRTITTALADATSTEDSKPKGPPRRIRELIREKRKAVRLAHRTLNPAHKREANRMGRMVREQLDNWNSEKWDNRLRALTPGNPNLWEVVKWVKGRRAEIPPLQCTNGIAYTCQEKAECFAEAMEAQFQVNSFADDDPHFPENIEQEAQIILEEQLNHHNAPQDPVTIEEIRELIKTAPTNKAPGRDGITNVLLKNLPNTVLLGLKQYLNAMLRLSHFPSCWKVAEVVMVPKAGKNLKLPESYRPISLLSTLGKLAERTIATRLGALTERAGILPREQFGFRRGHSTEQQALRVTETILEAANHKDTAAMLLLDVEKAFDRVWHPGLIYKLKSFNLPSQMIALLHSYLTERTFCVKTDGCRSETKQIRAGVPQGSVLGPQLFNLYTADIPIPVATTLALFADDAAVVSSNRDPLLMRRCLQNAAGTLETWYKKWKMKINARKSRAILFNLRKRKPIVVPPIVMDGIEIPWAESAKYLGITFDCKLSWRPHIEATAVKARAAMRELGPILDSRRVNLNTKLLLYKTTVLPALTYGAAVWITAADTVTQKIQVVQNLALRRATAAPWFVRNSDIARDLRMEPVRTAIKATACRVFDSMATHENELARAVINYDAQLYTVPRRPRYFCT